MAASDHLNPGQFDNAARVQAWKSAPTVPGTEVFYGDRTAKYSQNPFSAHIPPAKTETFTNRHGEELQRNVPQHGIPEYDATHRVERPVRQQIPLDRLESTQDKVSRNAVSKYARRKTVAPAIDVTHWVNEDRYVIGEGNHRATVALLKGQSHVPADVTRIHTSKSVR